ncbi:hypothetical protein AURDEDRAFT_112436 [Auricularia subglabra TFB-10046 SS5]|nr:hypothetical protein AURDEDRAFT_112436 [Auricularia subglabra TFB-10046 SS5]
MQIEPFVFDAGFSAAPGLQMTAKRYRPACNSSGNLVLLFTHATGMTKEAWEPTIASIFKVASERQVAIREAWSLEWMSHGESAVVNEKVLNQYGQAISVKEWANAISNLLRNTIPSDCHVMGVGHSAGATALLFSSLTTLRSSIILVEPVLITPECFEEHKEERVGALQMLSQFTKARKSSWPSRAEAQKYLQSRIPWKLWDRAVLDLYVTHGLRQVEDDKVELKCNKRYEAAGYADMQPHIDGSGKLDDVREMLGVHMIFGQRDDSMPRYAHDSIVTGKKTDSVQWIPKAGHLVVQEAPSMLALAIANVLSLEAGKAARSKL